MNIFIGDSRVRGFKEVLSNVEIADVWARPGGKVSDMFKLVDDLTVLHQGEENSRTHFYIWVGICNLTKKITDKNTQYEEVLFDGNDLEKQREKLYDEFYKLSSHVFKQFGAPIFCPIFPMNIKQWNEHRLCQSKTSNLQFSHNYDQMQIDLEREVVLLNTFLIHLNVENSMSTPMFNNDFLHSRGKGRLTARYGDLTDGCHPNIKLILKFKKSFMKSVEYNSKINRH
jgi:hypothetical protein